MSLKYPKLLQLVPPTAQVEALEPQILTNWDSYPTHIKESILVEDILSILTGVQGTVVKFNDNRFIFITQNNVNDVQLATSSDSTLQVLASEILELAAHRNGFLESLSLLDDSAISHSFIQVVQTVLIQLESKLAQYKSTCTSSSFSLARLKLHLNVEFTTFDFYNRIAAPRNSKAIIEAVYTATSQYGPSDVRRALAVTILSQLMDAVCHEINLWIQHGITTPQSSIGLKLGADGSVNYDPSRVPAFIQPFAGTLYKAGLYRKILKDSNFNFTDYTLEKDITFITLQDLEASVSNIHQTTCAQVTRLALNNLNIAGRLDSLYNVSMAQRADWLALFLWQLEFEPNVSSIGRLFLDAISCSSNRSDEFIKEYELIYDKNRGRKRYTNGHLKSKQGVETNGPIPREAFESHLSFVCKQPWQLKIWAPNIENTANLASRIFTLQLLLKRLELLLSCAWLDLIKCRNLALEPNVNLKLHFTLLELQKMLGFCKRAQFYATCVIESTVGTTKDGIAQLETVATLGELYHSLEQSLETRLFFDNTNIFTTLVTTLYIAKVFAKHLNNFFSQAGLHSKYHGPKMALENKSKAITGLYNNVGFWGLVKNASQQFKRQTQEFQCKLQALVGNDGNNNENKKRFDDSNIMGTLEILTMV